MDSSCSITGEGFSQEGAQGCKSLPIYVSDFTAKTSPVKFEGKRPYKEFRLRNKKTGGVRIYRLYKEDDLLFLSARARDDKSIILDFNMSKLELEYDYDTDEEQLRSAKEMLVQENISAVEFCVKEDPMLLVGNLNECW